MFFCFAVAPSVVNFCDAQGSLVISPGKTLKRQFDEVIGELETWKRKRESRLNEFDTVQSCINEIRESLGMTTVCTKKVKNSITKANMDFLKVELERMRGEKVRSCFMLAAHTPIHCCQISTVLVCHLIHPIGVM